MLFRRRRAHGLLTADDEQRIVAAIRGAETRTSGEIRVHVEARCAGDPIEAARYWFARLGMAATAERNGVLFYLAARHRKFAVIGDQGIHDHVGDAFWAALRDRLEGRFRKGDVAGGLEEAILETGERLSAAFPPRAGGTNELPDEISYGDEASGGEGRERHGPGAGSGP